VPPGFLDALEWMLSGTTLNPWVEGWTFEASVDCPHSER
jgi:hypothetical protein